jgi:hypothetical protein
MYTCPECEETINQATEVCPFCGADLTGVAAIDESGAPAKKPSAKRVIIVIALVLGVLGLVAWFAVPWRISGSQPEAENHARESVAEVQQALAAYQASEGNFPASLDSLGDRVRAAAQKAQSAGYTLQYAPGQPDATGRVRTYTLTARAGNFGYLNFFTDESGVLRFTAENRSATVQDPPANGNL